MGSFGLGHKFSNEACEEDLCLTEDRDGSPLLDRLHGRKRFEGDIRAQHTGEVDASSLDKPPSGGNHGDTAVLLFGSTEPVEGFLASEVGQAQGVEVLNRQGASWHVIKNNSTEGAAGLCDPKNQKCEVLVLTKQRTNTAAFT